MTVLDRFLTYVQVETTSDENSTTTPTTPAERVVTEATVAALPDGAVVRLQPRAIVTDLAREAASKRHITLQEGA